MTFTIDIRNKRLRGGRITIDSRADSEREYKARKSMVYDLIADRRFDLIDAMRDGRLHVADVRAAQKAGKNALAALVAPSLNGAGPRAIPPVLTIGEAIARVIKRTKGNHSASGTVKNKVSLSKKIQKALGKDTPCNDVLSEQVEVLLFETPGWGPGRQESARQLGLQAWDVAIAREKEVSDRHELKPRLTANPWRGIKIKTATHRPTFLQREEWLRLEEANKDMPELALMALGALAGLRQGEAIRLRMGVDLDLDRRLIRVQARKGKQEWKPKTPRSERDVPINDRLYAILQRHIELGFSGQTYLLIVARRDRPMNEVTACEWTKRAFGRAEIVYGRANGFTNHTLRHTFASYLAQEDVQLLKIASLLGDTVKTVADHYAFLTPKDLDRAVHVLDRTLK